MPVFAKDILYAIELLSDCMNRETGHKTSEACWRLEGSTYELTPLRIRSRSGEDGRTDFVALTRQDIAPG